ncbi:MAG: 50S ribosomal protein L23 [Nanoarchaeota archaeon]
MTLQLKPLVTEKAVMLIESQNTLTFKADKKADKALIKKEIESLFSVKVEKVRVLVRGSHKYFYVRLKKQFPAIDVATKIGMI